jgi:endonuclease/exonuclease/phosphatase (EEP) superfamily protein YafD
MSTSKPSSERTFQVIQYLSVIYVIFIALWFILWLAVGDKNWWLIVLNRIVPYLFLPTVGILFLLIQIRSFKVALPLLIPLLIFGTLYFPYLFPHTTQTNVNPNISVITYNALFSNTNYDQVAQVILTYQPDFVTFQEIQPVMMDDLKQRLGNVYPYSIMGHEHPYGTTAIFSRHPSTRAYTLDLEIDRTAVAWEAQINQKNIKVISAHLLAYGLQWVKVPDMPKAIMERTVAQNIQAQLIIDEIQEYEGIVILGCDCNSKETSSSYRILASMLNNSARVAGWSLFGETPENTKYERNIQHIDYIFYRGEVEPFQVVTIKNSGGSDHSPVLAFFEMKR